VTQLRRASADLHESKSVSAFARDDFYIGQVYEVTGPKGRPCWRRGEAPVREAARRAMCGVAALLCSRPSGRVGMLPP
jgi:hypothetical protein